MCCPTMMVEFQQCSRWVHFESSHSAGKRSRSTFGGYYDYVTKYIFCGASCGFGGHIAVMWGDCVLFGIPLLRQLIVGVP